MAEEEQMEEETLLLKKKRACPGCKLQQRKQLRRGFPLWELCIVWIIVLCNALPISSLFPFLYWMIRDFKIAKKEEDIGFYAGFVGCSFMLGRALTSIPWGIVADRYGRKPVILIGTGSVVIFNTLFGLSLNLWMALVARFCLGNFNALYGTIKAYAMEIVREEYQALALSAVTTAWGIGLIIGPAMGGFLVQPAEKYPSIFPKDSVFGRFPYFLPCFAISVFALLVMMICFWIPETMHNHEVDNALPEEPCGALEAASREPDTNGEAAGEEGSSLLKNWPLISSIIVYCVYSLQDMAYTEIFSLWANSPRKYGGLGYSSDDVGTVLVVSGLGVLVFQLSLYPYADRLLGTVKLIRLATILSIPVLASYPLIANLSGFTLSLVVNCASLAKNLLTITALTGLSILQNKAVKQHQRGAANGIATTAISVFKAIGPASAGVLFSWSEKRQDAAFFPGAQMVFFILNVTLTIGVAMTFKPFLVEA